jgi:tetratricopeptide (TPR) repeat protein
MPIRRVLLPFLAVWAIATPALAAVPTQSELDALRAQAAAHADSADAQFELAMAYARTPYLEAGWEALKRVNTLDPTFADKVVSRLEPKVALEPADAESRFRLAFAYYFQGKKELARAQFEQLVALTPRDPWAYDYLGFLQAEANLVDEAYKTWQQALTIDPNNAVAHYLVGQIYYRQGKFLQAAGEIANALKLRSTSGLQP